MEQVVTSLSHPFLELTQGSYNRARYYDPSAGRFLSEDPIGLPGGDLNFYRYVWGRPLGFRDSLGWWGIGGIAGGSVGLGAGNFIAGSASGQFGYFRDKNGQSSAGWAGSYGGGAGCPCENSPSLVPNNGSTPTALGAWAGVGVGAFFTNADNVFDLEGPFDNVELNTPGISIQYQWGKNEEGRPIRQLSFTLGPTAGLGIAKYKTNTCPNYTFSGKPDPEPNWKVKIEPLPY